MRWKRTTAAAFAAVIATVSATWAGGVFQTWVGIGWPSFCQTQVTGSAGQVCQVTVPAGPSVFGGTEVAPFDLYQPGTIVTSGGPQSAFVNITQLGQGPVQVIANYTSGATVSMNNTTEWLVLQPPATFANSPVTIALPTTPVEGQIAHISCETLAYAPSVTVITATGQAVQPGQLPPLTGVFGQTSPQQCGAITFTPFATATVQVFNAFAFRYTSAVSPATSSVNVSPTWYRFQ